MLWDRSGSRAQSREEHGTFCALFGIVFFITFDYIYTAFSFTFKFSFLSRCYWKHVLTMNSTFWRNRCCT